MTHRRRTIALAFAALLGLVPLAPVAAQDFPTPAESRQIVEDAGLPQGADLGSGWSLGNAYTDESDSYPFVYYEATYSDRYGDRAKIYVAAYDRRSEDAAVEFGSNAVANIGSYLIPGEFTPTARETRELRDPAGCDDVERANGEDPVTYFFTGITSCHDTANDRVIVVIVSGLYDDERYQDATEPVLEVVLDIEPGGGSVRDSDK